MENKNVFIAIALSMSVLLFWGAFFEKPKPQNNISTSEDVKKQEQKIDNNITPNIDQSLKVNLVSREDSIKKDKRVIIENNNIVGSISLKGGLIDDVSFKKHKQDLKDNKNVIFLNPKETENGFFIETGWASVGDKVKVPSIDSVWSVIGNNVLNANQPVTLQWENGEGIVFKKIIQLDEKYLFKISQKVENNTNNLLELYPYAQITRNKIPEDIQNFYISHEGFIGVFDEELKEDDYDDIEEKKIVREANEGWLGITDKYWMTVLVPKQDENFKSTFLYKEGFKANYILNNPTIIKPSSSNSNDVRLFVAAKEVETIDTYAANQNIEKLDLTIDWGWFYFFTKPLFFVIDYLFKISGNFGIAIVLITIGIRLLFFPLANYSFRSMAKMKALQPEMVRLKEVHKNDKMKLQQDMMALYKKEKVNPASGCLPVLLFNVFGLIPWDPPSFLVIGIWPILMGLSMWVQQKLNPAPADPIQAKIFAFFPIFLTIILASFPSGLVVYWTVNNILTIAQQWVIMKKTKIKTN